MCRLPEGVACVPWMASIRLSKSGPICVGEKFVVGSPDGHQVTLLELAELTFQVGIGGLLSFGVLLAVGIPFVQPCCLAGLVCLDEVGRYFLDLLMGDSSVGEVQGLERCENERAKGRDGFLLTRGEGGVNGLSF